MTRHKRVTGRWFAAILICFRVTGVLRSIWIEKITASFSFTSCADRGSGDGLTGSAKRPWTEGGRLRGSCKSFPVPTSRRTTKSTDDKPVLGYHTICTFSGGNYTLAKQRGDCYSARLVADLRINLIFENIADVVNRLLLVKLGCRRSNQLKLIYWTVLHN